jgi:hypothetical protein
LRKAGRTTQAKSWHVIPAELEALAQAYGMGGPDPEEPEAPAQPETAEAF